MAWKYRGSCKSKEQALGILADQIEYLYDEKNYINKDVVDTLRGEMEGFAVEWSIPFCWELHEQILARRSDTQDSWYNSGCSWDSSGTAC
jgi:hypothetical protein